MEDKPKEVSKIEQEMKRLVARMKAESTALKKILKVLEHRSEDEVANQQSEKNEKENENNPNK